MLQEFKDCLRLAAQDLGHGIVDASGEAEVSDEHRARLSESVATLGRLNVLVGGPALLQKRHLCGGVQGDGVVAGLLLHEADAAAGVGLEGVNLRLPLLVSLPDRKSVV